jgi:nucleotide-binding universal stress UspA family protein
VPEQRLICAVDASPRADWVARYGGRLARRLGMRPVLLHAGEVAAPTRTADEERMIAGVAARQGLDAAELVTVQGAPVAALAALSEEADTGAIVVGSRGHGALRSLLVGSVAWQLAREAACPVVLAPLDTGESLTDERTVLCALDDDEDVEEAARLSTAIAARMRAQLVLAHVAPTDAPAEVPAEGVVEAPEVLAELEHGRRVLDRALAAADTVTGAESLVRTIRLDHGPAGPGIERLAYEERADLVVVGTPRRSRLGAALLGSAFEELRRGRRFGLVVCPARRPLPAAPPLADASS